MPTYEYAIAAGWNVTIVDATHNVEILDPSPTVYLSDIATGLAANSSFLVRGGEPTAPYTTLTGGIIRNGYLPQTWFLAAVTDEAYQWFVATYVDATRGKVTVRTNTGASGDYTNYNALIRPPESLPERNIRNGRWVYESVPFQLLLRDEI